MKSNFILTHFIFNDHHDNRAVWFSTFEAARYYSNILAYELPLTKEFLPEVSVDIFDSIEQIVKLLSIYETQKKVYITKNAIYGLASYRTLQSRLKNIQYAEAFQVVKLTIFNSSILNGFFKKIINYFNRINTTSIFIQYIL